jgi:hypothetical protein
MKDFDYTKITQISANIFFFIMIAFAGMTIMTDSAPNEAIKLGMRAQIDQVCIEGEWEECYGFGDSSIVEIQIRGREGGEKTLYIRKVK